MAMLSNGTRVFVDDFVSTSQHVLYKIKALLLEV